MPTKTVQGIPRTAKEAKKRGYKKVAKVMHANLSSKEKEDWVLLKLGSTPRPHMICHYDPETGEYDDCYEG